MKQKPIRTFSKATLLSAVLLCATSTSSLANESRTKGDLNEVQQELKKNQKSYQEQKLSLQEQQNALKQAEKAINKNSRELHELDQKIKANKKEFDELERQAKQLEEKRETLDELLSAQLKSAYMIGGGDYLKMLLNQQDTAKLERTSAYYEYFNKARLQQLEALKATLEKIAENQRALEENQAQLAKLREQEQAQQEQLLAAKEKRSKQVAQLQAQLNQLKDSIDYLKDNEQTLKDTLVRLEQEKNRQVDMLGLGGSKGKLRWPSAGKITERFGTKKRPGFNWKGVVIAAQEGSNIESIADGQVLFSDWLKGFGWVIVIDHGKGYMSLYGHAQTLLKDVGDTAYQGETIALVGQSGGQAQAGLYFEIRHKGKAVNPTSWCRAR